MASGKLPTLPETIEEHKQTKEVHRTKTASWIPDGRQETQRPSSRRKLSAENAHRLLFQQLKRLSQDELLPAENSTSTRVDQPVKLLLGERELGQKPTTILSVIRLNVDKFPEKQAYGYKPDDKWLYISYRELFDFVRRAAKGFISFGLKRFSGVAIIGRNSPEWVIANFAAIYAGGIVVPIAPAVSVDDCCSIMQNTHCDILVVGSLKHLDAFEEIRSEMTYIKAIIKYGKGSEEKSNHFHTWSHLLEMGDHVGDERLKERMAFQAPNLCCTIVHTPGTAGPSKPVMISHDNFVWTARALGRRLSCSVASAALTSIFSYAHISGLIFNLYLPLLFAATVYFITTPNVFEWTREVQPTMMYAPRLVFDELRLKLTSHLTRSCFSRLIYWWARTIGFRGYKARIQRRPMPFCWSLANALIYRKIRTMIGLQNSREIFIAGRLISEESLKFFASLNMTVLEMYGMTESTGPITVSAMPDMFRITSVGKDLDGGFSKIMQADKNGIGDLRIRGRHVFMGYLNQPEKTSDAFDKDGWFKTGDKARRDGNGFLYVVGKDSDVVTLENGETINSGPIETMVREALPILRNCMLVGNGKAYLAMLMTIRTVVDWQTLEASNILAPDTRKWFQKLGYQDESIDNFVQNPDKRILNKIQSIIDRLNARLQPSHRIQKWTILPHDFTVPGGEITWTFNNRRFVIEEKYAETINSLYVEK